MPSQLIRAKPEESCDAGHKSIQSPRMSLKNTETLPPNVSSVPQMRSYHIFNTLTQIYIPLPLPTVSILHPPPTVWQTLAIVLAATRAASCFLGNQLSRSLRAWPPWLVGQTRNTNLPSEPGPNLPTFAVCQGPRRPPRPHLGLLSAGTGALIRRSLPRELWSYCLWPICLRTFCLANDRCHVV